MRLYLLSQRGWSDILGPKCGACVDAFARVGHPMWGLHLFFLSCDFPYSWVTDVFALHASLSLPLLIVDRDDDPGLVGYLQ